MSENLIGMTINGYEILSQVGQGGMATVFLARQQSMDRNVALKFLPKQFMNDDTYLQRFEQEVKIVSQLEHRNIVPVYDYGEHEGQPYIAMRYMPAGSVDDLQRQGRIPIERVLNIIEQIAPALDYAHNKDILHRDLKPSNILLDDGGGAFITDFGIARILSEQGTAITTQGVVGTPSYMSPEQAQAHKLDGRSDVYSLGVMLFEMITGRRPFESDTPYSIAVMQVTTPPPSPRDYNDTVTSTVEKVILKALRKKPEKRYTTATELASALKLAIERPYSTHDTEPRMQPAAQQSTEPIAPPEPQQFVRPIMQPSYPQGGTSQASQPVNRNPSRSVSYSVRPVKAKPKGSNMLMGIAVGGIMGCALLAGIVIIVTLALGSLSNSTLPATTIVTPTQLQDDAQIDTSVITTSQASRTTIDVDATLDTAQQTLEARNAETDATLTAVALAHEATPPTAIPEFVPVGDRGTPTLNTALQSVRGKLIYFDQRFDSDDNGSFEVVSVNLDTWIDTQLTSDLSDNTYPQSSPDGRWIAFQSDRDGDFDIYVVNVVGGQLRKITENSVWDRLPAWSSDSEWVIYSSDVRGDGTFDLYRGRADGSDNQVVYSDGRRNSHARYSSDGRYLVFTSGTELRDATTWEIMLYDTQTQIATFLTDNDVRDSSPSFSPDGTRILFITTTGEGTAVATMNLEGTEHRILYDGVGNNWDASYSPDGQFIVVTSSIENDDQLFLMEADGSNIQQITSAGGAYASWIPEIAD
jgi:serine/threonine protein kinase